MKKFVYFLPIVFFVIVGLFLYKGISLDPSEMPSALIDKSIPPFVLPELTSNKPLSNADIKGQVSLINVWATWCVSCRMEHPYLLQLSQQGVRIIGLNYKDDDSNAKNWLKELGNPYAIIIADTKGKLGLDLGVFGAPESFLIDKNGIIRYKRVGVIDERIWTDEIQPIYNKLILQ